MDIKPVTDLTPDDLARFPLWQFDLGTESVPCRGETWVVPATELPVTSLDRCAVGVALSLGDRTVIGLLGNIALGNLRATQEFATLPDMTAMTVFSHCVLRPCAATSPATRPRTSPVC